MENFENFTNLYSLSKTLRFELKPVGKTAERLEEMVMNMNDDLSPDNLIATDVLRAQKYLEVKKLIDRYHKAYIEKTLTDFQLVSDSSNKKDSLQEYYFWYFNKNDVNRKEALTKIQDNLRQQISKRLTSQTAYQRMFKSELIKEDLPKFLKDDKEKLLVKEFENFTTYFIGFHENRENMYTDEEKSTAIAYRLIHENLPKFIDNMTSFDKIKQVPEFANHFSELYENLKSSLNAEDLPEDISKMFEINYFNSVLTQKQIDVYNTMIGGYTEEGGEEKIQGLNEYINLYNQQQTDKADRLPKLKPLFKQILSDRESKSWVAQPFTKASQVLDAINDCYENFEANVFASDKLQRLLLNIDNYDLGKIYLSNDLMLTNISQQLFGSWSVIQEAIKEDIIFKNPRKAKEDFEKYEEKIKKLVTNADSYSIAYINECVGKLQGKEVNVEEYFKNLLEDNNSTNVFSRIAIAHNEAKALLPEDYPESKRLENDKENIDKIKNLLDAIKELQHFIKLLCGKGTEAEKDENFYGDFGVFWNELNEITTLYNKVRNFATKKPYSEEKVKLNFENSTLLNGWDVNKEPDNTSVILRKDGLYYLAIMNKKHNKVFIPKNIKTDGDCYEKMDYKLRPGANKMFPKVFFSKSRIAEFNPSTQLLENYKKETHKKGNTFNLKDCQQLIDFFKASINKHSDWKQFDFKFSDTSTYQDLSGFYREVEQQGYKVTFRNV